MNSKLLFPILIIVFSSCSDHQQEILEVQKSIEENIEENIEESESLSNEMDSLLTTMDSDESSITIASQIETTLNTISGKVEISNIVYGGMYKEGKETPTTPNYQPVANFSMTIFQIKGDSAWIYCVFTTDKEGDFSFTVPNGTFGFYTDPLMYNYQNYTFTCFPERKAKEIEDHWNINIPCPLIIKDKNISGIVISHEAVGYAP